MLAALEEMYSIFYQLNQNASIISPIFASVFGGNNVTPLWATMLCIFPLP
jgi:hypothetical protein